MSTYYRPQETIDATNKLLQVCAAKTRNADPVIIDALERELERLRQIEREWFNRTTGRETRYEGVTA